MKCISSMWDCIFWQCANIMSYRFYHGQRMVSMMTSHVISVSSIHYKHSCVQVILFRFSCILCVYCILFVRLYHNTFGIIAQLEIDTNCMIWNKYLSICQIRSTVSALIQEFWTRWGSNRKLKLYCYQNWNFCMSQPCFIARKFKIINYPLPVFLLRQVCIIMKE